MDKVTINKYKNKAIKALDTVEKTVNRTYKKAVPKVKKAASKASKYVQATAKKVASKNNQEKVKHAATTASKYAKNVAHNAMEHVKHIHMPSFHTKEEHHSVESNFEKWGKELQDKSEEVKKGKAKKADYYALWVKITNEKEFDDLPDTVMNNLEDVFKEGYRKFENFYAKGGSVDSEVKHALKSVKKTIEEYEQYILDKYLAGKAAIYNSNHRIVPNINKAIRDLSTSAFSGYVVGYKAGSHWINSPDDVTISNVQHFFTSIKKDTSDVDNYEYLLEPLGYFTKKLEDSKADGYYEKIKAEVANMPKLAEVAYADGGEIDNPKALGIALKKELKLLYDIDVDTRYVKTVRPLDNAWYEISTFKSKQVIPNELRREILELQHAGKTLSEIGVRNLNDISYGNVEPHRVTTYGGVWKEWLKRKQNFAEGGALKDEQGKDAFMIYLEGYDAFVNDVWQSDDDLLSKKGREKQLKDYLKTFKDLEDKKINPSKVIGTGYQPQHAHRLAKEWLEDQIRKTRDIIETEGRSDVLNKMNFHHWVKGANKLGWIDEQKSKELGESMGIYKDERLKFEHGGTTEPVGMVYYIYRSNFKDPYSFYKDVDTVIVKDPRLPKIFKPRDISEIPVVIKETTYPLSGKPTYIYAEPDKEGSWAFSGSFLYSSDSRADAIMHYPIPLHDRDMRKEKRFESGGETNRNDEEITAFVRYNKLGDMWSVDIEGTLYGEFSSKENAISYAKEDFGCTIIREDNNSEEQYEKERELRRYNSIQRKLDKLEDSKLALLGHNGDTVTIDGLKYKIKATQHQAIYPYKHIVTRVDFHPVNKNSAHYKDIKSKLKDEWLLSFDDMTDDHQIEVLEQIGYYNGKEMKHGGTTTKKELSTNQKVANEIIKEFGGVRHLNAMTGAYDVFAIENGVIFKVKNAAANYVKIVKNDKDLYNIEVGRLRNEGEYKVIAKVSDATLGEIVPIVEGESQLYISVYKEGGKTTGSEQTPKMGGSIRLYFPEYPDSKLNGMYSWGAGKFEGEHKGKPVRKVVYGMDTKGGEFFVTPEMFGDAAYVLVKDWHPDGSEYFYLTK